MQRFSEFFNEWISGYYQNAHIGKDGDFYTAVSSTRFFGGAIANYILKNLENGNLKLPLNIIDIGANNANLINDIYDFLNALSDGVVDKCNFFLIESNAKILPNKAINLKILQNLQSLNPLSCNSFFIANEFFDALPCELYDNGKIAFLDSNKEVVFLDSRDFKIALDSRDSKSFKDSQDSTEFIESLLNITKEQNILKGEIPLSYFDFCKTLKSINPLNQKWIFNIFDYGNNFYTNDFNIRIFCKHKVISLFNTTSNDKIIDYKSYFQTSDITYNVPFLLLDRAFRGVGGKQVLFKKQHMALVEDFGILDLLQKFYNSNAVSSNVYIRESNKIKTLLNVLNDNFKIAIYINFKPKLI